jgi:hypothetical protein
MREPSLPGVPVTEARPLAADHDREPEEAVLESVRWLVEHDQLKVANPLKV